MENFSATESERTLLSSIILDGFQHPDNPKLLLRAMSELQPPDFAGTKSRGLYRVMIALYGRNEPFFDAVAIQDEVNRRKVLSGTEGVKYLSEIFEGAATTTGADYHIGQIQKARYRRDVAVFKSKIADIPVDGFTEKAETAFLELRERTTSTGGFSTFQEVTRQAFNEIENARHGRSIQGVPSGFATVDKYTGGWQPGEHIVIAGRPGMGKSVIAKDLAESAGVPVAYFNLEMSNTEQGKRHISGICGVDFGRIKTGRTTEDDAVKIIEGLNRKGDFPIFYNDKASLTISEICSRSLGMKIRENIGLVIIDYLQLITPNEKLAARQEEVSALSRRLKLLARDLEIPVITLAQLNRECEKRGNKRPLQSDLRESGAIEQDSDIIAFLYRDHIYDEEADPYHAEFIIEKHRNGPTGTIDLHFDGKHQKFSSVSYVKEGEK